MQPDIPGDRGRQGDNAGSTSSPGAALTLAQGIGLGDD